MVNNLLYRITFSKNLTKVKLHCKGDKRKGKEWLLFRGAACVLTAIGSKGGGKAWMAWAILACAVVGVIAARYAFYAASVI